MKYETEIKAFKDLYHTMQKLGMTSQEKDIIDNIISIAEGNDETETRLGTKTEECAELKVSHATISDTCSTYHNDNQKILIMLHGLLEMGDYYMQPENYKMEGSRCEILLDDGNKARDAMMEFNILWKASGRNSPLYKRPEKKSFSAGE